MANSSLLINQGTNAAVNFDLTSGTNTQVVGIGYGTINTIGTLPNITLANPTGTVVAVDHGTITLSNPTGTTVQFNNGTLNAGTIGTVTGAGTLTNLGSVTNIGQVYNAGTIQSGTLINSGTTTGVGTITNLGSVTNVGMLNAATISSLPNLPQGSINVTAGTFVMTSGTLNVGTAVMPSGTLNVGTINTGTINLGTITGKDANAVAQTSNPLAIGGTDSGGTVRTVLVNAAGAMSVSGASSGTFNNISTGTMQTLGTVGTVQNILAGTISGLQNGTITTGTINAGTINLGSVVGNQASGVVASANPVLIAGTNASGTIFAPLVSNAGVMDINVKNTTLSVNLANGTISAGTINTGTFNVGTITAGTINTGTVNAGTINTGTINAGTINNGSIVVTVGTIAAGTVHLAGTVLDNFTGLGTFTITLGTLASSGSVGRQSTLVDNTSNLWPAALIGCQITPGTVTAAGQVNVYLIRSDNGGGPIQDDLTGASDALGTVNNSPLLGIIPINIGTNTMYKAVYDTSFLGHLGPKFGVMVQHALGNPFAAGGSQSITYQGITPKFS